MTEDFNIDLPKWNDVISSMGTSRRISKVEQIGIGHGMLGRVFRLTANDASFVLKMVSNDDLEVAKFKPSEREALTYAWLEKQRLHAGGTVPRFHHWEPVSEGFQCMLLEDLTAKGAITLNPLTGLQLEQLLAGLVSIARVHSAGSKRNEGGLADNPPGGYLLTRRSPELIGIVTGALAGIERSLGKYYLPRNYNDMMRISRSISVGNVLRDAHGMSSIIGLCHGDLWSNNIMFVCADDLAGIKATVIDWQFSTWGNPLVDVAFLMISSMSPELRKAEERVLLASYYESLGDRFAVEQKYTFDECLRDYRLGEPYGALMTLANFESYLAYPDKSELPLLLERLHAVAKEFFR